MTTVLKYPKVDDYWAIAVALSQELATSAVERDRLVDGLLNAIQHAAL